MDEINSFMQIDWSSFVSTFCIIGFAIVVFVGLIEKLSVIFGKPVKWMTQRNKDHALLCDTITELHELVKQQEKDAKLSIECNRKTNDELEKFVQKTKEDISVIKNNQRDLSESINRLIQLSDVTGQATMEQMCDRITQKTKHYINVLHGIPEDEYDDFVRLCDSYSAIGGNHGAKAKYEYCINNLDILPIETKVIEKK